MWRNWPVIRVFFRERLRRIAELDHAHTDGDVRRPLADHPGLGEQ